MRSYLFDLEKAVAAWRRPFEHDRTFSREDLEELEAGLRDRVEVLVAAGLSEEAAFREAVRRVGSYGTAEAEYRKVYWGKRRRHGELLHELQWRHSMLKNYLKLTLRTLWKQKGYAFLNVAGLALGMACALLILLYVREEYAFDRFHEHADDIYRLVERFVPVDAAGKAETTAATPAPWAPALKDEFPEIRRIVRLYPSQRALVQAEDRRFYEERFAWADANVFAVFTFPLVQGDPEKVLASPGTVVLSETMARKYFGGDNPVGKTLTHQGEPYTVTGVMRDMPSNAHFRFDFLASLASFGSLDSPPMWIYHNFYTYLLLPAGYDPARLEAKLPAFIDKYLGKARTVDMGSELRPFLQPLKDAHLHSAHLSYDIAPQGDLRYLYVFATIALFILLVACVNFMNLATARAARRAREVGLRKVLGAHRSQLIRQFMGESMLLSCFALLVAVVLIELLLPVFNGLSGRSLQVHYAQDPVVAAGLLGLMFGVGLVAGSYPALVLSGFRPVEVMKGRLSTGLAGQRLRQGLVVFQFVISITLMIGTALVLSQLSYMQHKKLGFDREQVVVLPLPSGEVRTQYEAFRESILGEPGLVQVGAASNLPGRTIPGNLVKAEGHEPRSMRMLFVDAHFPEVLGLEVLQGRTFSADRPADLTSGFILNEAATRELDWEDPLGKSFAWVLPDTVLKRGEVIGVVKDFHIKPLQEAIEPLVLFVWPERLSYVYVRVAPGQMTHALAALEERWQAFFPAYPFEHALLDERIDGLYRNEQQLAEIFGYFSGLAIVIACLGLFGLASFTAQQRTKEIGVRKVLGATVPGLVALLSKDFLGLVLVAFVIATPVAYVAMQRWLEGFAYRIDLSWPIFLVAGALALAIALLTVSYQAVKAALADPVKSLRYE